MREILIAFAIFALLVGFAFGVRSADALKLLYLGAALIVGGLAFSTPCAVVYHFRLYRALAPRGELDRRWLLNPTSHHKKLRQDDLPRVMPWFYAGAAGWTVSVLGCILLGLAAYLARR